MRTPAICFWFDSETKYNVAFERRRPLKEAKLHLLMILRECLVATCSRLNYVGGGVVRLDVNTYGPGRKLWEDGWWRDGWRDGWMDGWLDGWDEEKARKQ